MLFRRLMEYLTANR